MGIDLLEQIGCWRAQSDVLESFGSNLLVSGTHHDSSDFGCGGVEHGTAGMG